MVFVLDFRSRSTPMMGLDQFSVVFKYWELTKKEINFEKDQHV